MLESTLQAAKIKEQHLSESLVGKVALHTQSASYQGETVVKDPEDKVCSDSKLRWLTAEAAATEPPCVSEQASGTHLTQWHIDLQHAGAVRANTNP